MFLVAGAFGAQAAKPQEGDEPRNTKGLCTAYFNGQKKGHEKGSPGPFAALEEKGSLQDVYDYCSGLEKGIGGNPDENGRFTDCFDDSDGNPDTESCSDGAQP